MFFNASAGKNHDFLLLFFSNGELGDHSTNYSNKHQMIFKRPVLILWFTFCYYVVLQIFFAKTFAIVNVHCGWKSSKMSNLNFRVKNSKNDHSSLRSQFCNMRLFERFFYIVFDTAFCQISYFKAFMRNFIFKFHSWTNRCF